MEYEQPNGRCYEKTLRGEFPRPILLNEAHVDYSATLTLPLYFRLAIPTFHRPQ